MIETMGLAFLVASALGSILYMIMDRIIGEGRIENKVKNRAETLKRAAVPTSIANVNAFSNIAQLHDVLKRQPFSKKIQQMMLLSGWTMPLSMFILLDFTWSAIIFFIINLLTKNFLISALAGGFVAFIPYLILVINKNRYLTKFTMALPDALMMMKSALQAGQGLQASFQVVAEEGPRPVSTEFSRLIREIELGAPVSEALNEMYQRVPTLDLRLFILGIHIQHEIGGNLVELFDHVEKTIRDRISLTREIKVLSAQGKMTGAVLIALPIGLVFIIAAANPSFFKPLLEDEAGRKLIWTAVGFQLMGSYFIHKLTYFKAIN